MERGMNKAVLVTRKTRLEELWQNGDAPWRVW